MPVIPILRAGLNAAGVSAAFPELRNYCSSLAPTGKAPQENQGWSSWGTTAGTGS